MDKLIIESPSVFKIATGPVPSFDPSTHVLIEVLAAGINRIDLLILDGKTKPQNVVTTPGLEIVGRNTQTKEIVIALVEFGGFAQYVAVPKESVIVVDLPLSIEKIAALPEALAVAAHTLIRHKELIAGAPVLIHGGTSGMGNFLIQVAKKYSKAVITTVGENNKFEFCHNLGIEHVFNYHEDSFEIAAQKLGGVNFAIDILGGKYFQKTISSMAVGGKVMVMAVMAGSIAEVNLAAVLMKNLTIEGMTIKNKANDVKAALIRSALKELSDDLVSGKIKAMIDSVFDYQDHETAFARLRNRQNLGKIILRFNQ
jgi:NADPH2:quinone reductase